MARFSYRITFFQEFSSNFGQKMHFVMYFSPFLAIFQASTLIFKYSGFFNPITCIHFLKALDVSFHLSYNSSVYHKNCGVNNFYTRLRLERHQDLRTRPNLAGWCNNWKSLKNLIVGVFETDFKQVPFVFR